MKSLPRPTMSLVFYHSGKPQNFEAAGLAWWKGRASAVSKMYRFWPTGLQGIPKQLLRNAALGRRVDGHLKRLDGGLGARLPGVVCVPATCLPLRFPPFSLRYQVCWPFSPQIHGRVRPAAVARSTLQTAGSLPGKRGWPTVQFTWDQEKWGPTRRGFWKSGPSQATTVPSPRSLTRLNGSLSSWEVWTACPLLVTLRFLNKAFPPESCRPAMGVPLRKK